MNTLRLSRESLARTIGVGRMIGAILITSILFCSGCSLIPRSEHHRSSSVVAFLFPDEQPLLQEPAIPVLPLPLRVGIAFVPDENVAIEKFSQSQKQQLLEKIAEEFRELSFVHSIQTVPELYLRRGGGFANLDQVRGLLGIDVIVLLSYDQMQFTTENKRSIAYWTLVGAYLVNGNRNDTHTLMAATVYDIASRTLLFHAAGVDQTRGSSAFVYTERELRDDSAKSLGLAGDDLLRNLEGELARFQEAIRTGTTTVKIERRPGYSGGGAWNLSVLLWVSVVLIGARWVRKSTGAAA